MGFRARPMRREHSFIRSLAVLPHVTESLVMLLSDRRIGFAVRERRLGGGSSRHRADGGWAHADQGAAARGRGRHRSAARDHRRAAGEDADGAEVRIGTETNRGPWVAALLAAGYAVYAVDPLQASRYRDRLSVAVFNDTSPSTGASGHHPVSDGMVQIANHRRLVTARRPTRQIPAPDEVGQFGRGAISRLRGFARPVQRLQAIRLRQLGHQLPDSRPAATAPACDAACRGAVRR